MKHLTDESRAEVLGVLKSMKEDVRELAFHGGPLDARFTIPRELMWQALPGRDGVVFFNVPASDGGVSLYAGLFVTEAGAFYTNSMIDCSRLIVVSAGILLCNNSIVRPGDSLWLAPNESTTWHSTPGCRGVVFYDVAKPDNAILADESI